MRSFFEWLESAGMPPERPWLVLGKGPSLALADQYELKGFMTLGLNHAVREHQIELAHAVDLEVVQDCGTSIEHNSRFLIMPWVPHVDLQPGLHTLGELSQTCPTLARLREQNRLLWYNLGHKNSQAGSPIVRARYSSACVVLDLLGLAGIHTVRSLGVDGGTTYAPQFDDLVAAERRLTDQHWSYDVQFPEIARVIHRHGIDYAPLNVESPIRVYVGATEAEDLPVKVLEYSIRKHTSMSVNVYPLYRAPIEIPEPADQANRQRTRFSLQRFLIPELAERRGRAIYLDSDMLVFSDLRALWAAPFEGGQILAIPEGTVERRAQFSVMVLNCEELDWDIHRIVAALDQNNLTYEQLMYDMVLAPRVHANLSPSWNSLEHFKRGKTRLLHYTNVPTQPWISRRHPLGYLWVSELLEALDSGWLSPHILEYEVDRGHVRPSLLYQIQHCLPDSLRLPEEALHLDEGFLLQPGHGDWC